MSLDEVSVFKAHPDALFTAVEEGGVLLHVATHATFILNKSGVFIWQGLTSGQTIKDVSQALTEAFEVTPEQAQKSTLDFAQALLEQALVTLDNEAP